MTLSVPVPPREAMLFQHLEAILGEFSSELFNAMREHLEWVTVLGGSMLIRQGDPGSSMYIVVSGRLRAVYQNHLGETKVLGDICRGEVIGEMSLYTQEPRTASVLALRDTVLVRLSKAGFDRLLELSPRSSVAITKQIIARLRNSFNSKAAAGKPVTMALVPLSAEIDIQGFANRFCDELKKTGASTLVHSQTFSDTNDATLNSKLDQLEFEHDTVVLLADSNDSIWVDRCLRHADEVIWIADAEDDPDLREVENRFSTARSAFCAVSEVLVLMHKPGTFSPVNTSLWLEHRPAVDHIHMRHGHLGDMARFARIQTRTATGLVLAGGGAKGFAHLGVLKALEEFGIEVDFVGGTSIGAVMASYAASDLPANLMIENARKAFEANPTRDFSFFPVISLIRGRRLHNIITAAVAELVGHKADVTDLWKNFFCVATNYSRANEEVIDKGCLVKGIMSSIAIPGALPPVLRDGEILCDGGTFNNFPVDVMRRRRGVGKVIGVDLSTDTDGKVNVTEIPSNWELFKDKFRKPSNKKYSIPSLTAYLLNVTLLYSSSRQQQSKGLVDLYFNPDTRGVGMLDWSSFDEVVERGYQHAKKILKTKL